MVVSVCKSFQDSDANSCAAPFIGSEDLRSAYRQIPLSKTNVAMCIVAIWDIERQEVRFYEMWGQPFGAGHAVPNFYRFASLLAEIAQKLLHLHIDNYFDDFFHVEPKFSTVSASWSFRNMLLSWELIGIRLGLGPLVTSALCWAFFSMTDQS